MAQLTPEIANVLDSPEREAVVIVGWSMQPRMKKELVIHALRMAWFRGHPKLRLIFLWGSLKVAHLHGGRFATRRAAMDEVIDWMSFYNHRRLHDGLGYGIRKTGARSEEKQGGKDFHRIAIDGGFLETVIIYSIHGNY